MAFGNGQTALSYIDPNEDDDDNNNNNKNNNKILFTKK